MSLNMHSDMSRMSDKYRAGQPHAFLHKGTRSFLQRPQGRRSSPMEGSIILGLVWWPSDLSPSTAPTGFIISEAYGTWRLKETPNELLHKGL